MQRVAGDICLPKSESVREFFEKIATDCTRAVHMSLWAKYPRELDEMGNKGFEAQSGFDNRINQSIGI